MLHSSTDEVSTEGSLLKCRRDLTTITMDRRELTETTSYGPPSSSSDTGHHSVDEGSSSYGPGQSLPMSSGALVESAMFQSDLKHSNGFPSIVPTFWKRMYLFC